jgi:hypothetical protein
MTVLMEKEDWYGRQVVMKEVSWTVCLKGMES